MSDSYVCGAIPVERGCGEREKGVVYAECGMGPGGSPIEEFLLDPPCVLDVEAMGVTPRGVRLFQYSGVWHIADWVGSQHYKNVADFVEEWRRFGASRRLPSTLEFDKLTADSRVMLLHARAYADNWRDYFHYWDDCTGRDWNPCLSYPRKHSMDTSECCSGFWYQDIEGGRDVFDGEHPRKVKVEMPSFTYDAASRPAQIIPSYRVAAFAVMPITRLVTIKDTDGGTHKQNAENARRSGLPVDVVEE